MAGDAHSGPLDVTLKHPKSLKYFAIIGKKWAPKVVSFGAFGGTMFLFFTDWKLFMDKIPFYRGKFEEKEPIV